MWLLWQLLNGMYTNTNIPPTAVVQDYFSGKLSIHYINIGEIKQMLVNDLTNMSIDILVIPILC